MAVAPVSGIYAMYRRQARTDGHDVTIRHELAYWNEDGDGVVLDDNGHLALASNITGFIGYDDCRRTVIPAPAGIRAVFKTEDSPEFMLPVVGWVVDSDPDAHARPLTICGDEVTAEYAGLVRYVVDGEDHQYDAVEIALPDPQPQQ